MVAARGRREGTYRADPISSHNQIYHRLGAVFKRHPHTILAEILQSNKFLIKLDQILGSLGSQCLLQDKTFHPARSICISRIMRDPRINNLACVCVSRKATLMSMNPRHN